MNKKIRNKIEDNIPYVITLINLGIITFVIGYDIWNQSFETLDFYFVGFDLRADNFGLVALYNTGLMYFGLCSLFLGSLMFTIIIVVLVYRKLLIIYLNKKGNKKNEK